jgi:glycerol-3-phosphate cytidylyltransferase
VSVIGYCPGVFDMFHVGHLNILRRAKINCDFLIAGVVTDEVVELVKGQRPVVPLAERMEIVAALRVVDDVVADWSVEKIDIWRQVRFDVIFKGDDWRGTPKGDRLEASFAEAGVKVVYFPYTQNTSSTLLRELLTAAE